MNMNRALALAGMAFLALPVAAQTKTFTVVGDKLEFRNLANVESVTEFETFNGRTTKVSGALQFNPATRTGSGRLVVDVASIDTGIPLRNEHMRSADWLNAEKFPTITFETTKVQRQSGDRYRVTGKLTIKGVTRTVTTDATVRYRAAGAQTQAAGFDGNVIQVSTRFNIRLKDYNVNIPAPAKGKVGETVTLSLSAYAVAK